MKRIYLALAVLCALSGAILAQNTFLRNDGTFAQVQNGDVGGATSFPTPIRAGDIIYWNGSIWTSLPGNNSGTQFLQETSSGVPSWASISLFTSVASGTVPASGGGTTNFLRADGTWAAPSGSRVLLNTLTASSSAFLEDTTHFTATYDDYEIVFENLVPSTAALLATQLYVGSVLQTASYSYTALGSTGTTTSNVLGNTATTSIGSFGVSASSTGIGVSGTQRIYGINSATKKLVEAKWAFDAGSFIGTSTAAGTYTGGTSAVTGMRWSMPSGNITSGKIKIYGLQ